MGRKIVIVGNGEIAEGLAGFIDAADLVMRFNDCRSAGPGGRRTDIVAVCNTGRPGKAMTADPGWAGNASILQASAIWCVRDPSKFRAMRSRILHDHPELDDFCDDYTEGFAALARENGKDFHIVPAATHDALDRALAARGAAPYIVPSTGAVAIAEILCRYSSPDNRVFLAGFGHQGWDGHPWVAEKAWVDDMTLRGLLSRLSSDDFRRYA